MQARLSQYWQQDGSGCVPQLILALYRLGLPLPAASFTRGSLGITQQTRKDEVEERRQRQASSVAFWLVPDRLGENPVASACNGSGVPVYDVTVWWRVGEGVGFLIKLAALSPREAGQHLLATKALDRLGKRDELLAMLRQTGMVSLSAQFRDSSNVWWYRDFQGLLHEVTAPESNHDPDRPDSPPSVEKFK